jgi:ABC-type antimicrobial peptide transport system permease subunit
MALGAQRQTVLWMVLRESLVLVLLGGVAGSLASWAAMELAEKQLASMLYGLRPTDPLTAVIALSILLLTALAASYWPARRAASVDPIIALRQE